MPFASENRSVPIDPSEWARIRALPHIVVHPKQPLPEGIDDWIVPGTAYDDGPDDWIAPPPPATPPAGQLPPGAQPNTNFASVHPAVRPDPFAAYWSQIPTSRLGALAWAPPYLPPSGPSSNNNFAAPASPPPIPRPPTLGLDPLSWLPTQSLPAPNGGLPDGLVTLATSPPATPPFPPRGILGGLDAFGIPSPAVSPTPTPPVPRPPTLGLDPLPWLPPQSLLGPSIPNGGIFGGLAALGMPSAAASPTPAPPVPRPPTLGLDPLPWLPTQSLLGPTIPKGGILGGPAALGTPSPAPPTPSLPGGSFPGPGIPASPPMPGTLQAFFEGLRAGSTQLAQSAQSFLGPPPVSARVSPAAQPLGWSDLTNPSRIAPKVAYQFAQSYPTLAGGTVGGIIGGELGAAVGPEGVIPGALIGGGLGAAALSAAQTLGPVYAAELQKNPNDPEGAWNRAWKQAEISGVFAGASWAVFPVRFFQGPVKHLVFQIFGVQPAVAVGQRVTSNIVEGRPATEGLGEAYGQGVVGTAIPALGHAAVSPFLPARASAIKQRPAEPVTPQFKEGSFSISDWTGYPEFAPKPKGPFRLLQGEEYRTARNAADRINEKRRDADPAKHKDMQIHEIHPVKFGGHPTDSENKIVLPVEQHRLLNGWWYRRQLSLERGGSKGSSKSGRSTRGRSK